MTFQGWMHRNFWDAGGKKCPSLYSFFACSSCAVVTWPCDVIVVSNLLDMNIITIFSIGTQHRHNSWLAGHYKAMANSMSAAYVHNRWWYRNKRPISLAKIPTSYHTLPKKSQIILLHKLFPHGDLWKSPFFLVSLCRYRWVYGWVYWWGLIKSHHLTLF